MRMRWRLMVGRHRYERQAQPCPRQAYGTMPAQLDHVCVWHDDRWSRRRTWIDWLRNRLSAVGRWRETVGTPTPTCRSSGGIFWPEGEPRPRTCSYCGGAHPDDAIALIMRGWEVETTGKSYKLYLRPPGPRSPVPPVKVYTYHFDQRQADAFTAALRTARHD